MTKNKNMATILGVHLPELGVSERLNKLITGRTPTRGMSTPFYSNISNNPMSSWEQDKPKPAPYNYPNYQPVQDNKPIIPDIKSSGSYADSSAYRKEQAAREAIGEDWESAGTSNASDALSKMKSYISRLGAARDAYLRENEAWQAKNKTAIAGNRELIQKNQRTELGTLADKIRRNIFNTNQTLGVLGAADSSATGMAAKALAKAGGKERKSILTARGDDISTQNQEEQKAIARYNAQREQAYKWEEEQKTQALNKYNDMKDALDRLKDRVPDWKKSDIENLSNEYLSRFLNEVGQISASAKAYRDAIHSAALGMGATTAELKAAAIDITPPAELQTPEFSDELSLGDTTPDETEDFYNPNVKYKKKYSTDILGNPLVFDEG